jgi:hypothetical protein
MPRSVSRQKFQVGLSNAYKTAKVIVQADTRALRHIQRRRAFELVSAQQHHSEFPAQPAPGGVARLTLGHENSYHAVMPECPQVLSVAEYLAQTDTATPSTASDFCWSVTYPRGPRRHLRQVGEDPRESGPPRPHPRLRAADSEDTCCELEALRPAVRTDGAQALGLTY